MAYFLGKFTISPDTSDKPQWISYSDMGKNLTASWREPIRSYCDYSLHAVMNDTPSNYDGLYLIFKERLFE
jgi:hypothetical protein